MFISVFCAMLSLVLAAADESRSPMDWKSVDPAAISAWKKSAQAPDGLFVDAKSRMVTFLAEATGVRGGETVEFLAIGPLSDRAYESIFVSVASPDAIAAACARIGIPNGVPGSLLQARLWPQGEKVALRVRRVGEEASGPVGRVLDDAGAEGEDSALAGEFVWTGGERVDGGLVASTNEPCAVFALYTHAPSALQLGAPLDQSAAYGRFRAHGTLPKGQLWEISIAWSGRCRVLERELLLDAANVADALSALRRDAADHDVYVRLAFKPDVTIGTAAGIAKAFEALDGSALRMNGAAKGSFFYRAFLPDPVWRNRASRTFQPFEVHVAADGAKTFVFCEEDWSGEGLDPVLRPKSTPFRDWNEVAALIAGTGEQGSKINVMLLFAPKSTPVAQLTGATVLAPRISTFYVFQE